jgi:predicted RecB family nuclease
MRINPCLLEPYLKCPTKCWLVSRGEKANETRWKQSARSRNESYHIAGVEHLLSHRRRSECVISPPPAVLKAGHWRLATNVLVQTQDLESHVHAVERSVPSGQRKLARLIPVRFAMDNKVDYGTKLLLTLDALTLSEMLGESVSRGRIVHGDNCASLNVSIPPLAAKLREHLGKMTTLLADPSPPDLVLNRHCIECEFTARCREKATETDDLSLLSGMTEKERKKLHKKGIFTATQLSYTFRPRRRRKGLSGRPGKYQHSLRALAIRENKIHIVGSPELKIAGTPVYVDVEGVPDRDFYYLIGVRVGNHQAATQHSFWADDPEGEGKIWAEFLGILAHIENPLLIHYGGYETTFLKKMSTRHGSPPADSAAGRAIRTPLNLLSVIYTQIYFPTFSNTLKEIGQLLGARWDGVVKSGLQSTACRLVWEQSRNPELKASLLAYNQDDCAATATVAFHLGEIVRDAKSRPDVECAHDPKKLSTDSGAEIHRTFQSILSSAHFKYARSRISLSPTRNHEAPSPGGRRPAKRQRRKSFSAIKGKIVRVPRKRICPRCPGHRLSRSSRTANHSLIDLVFSKAGCHKTIVRHIGQMGYCNQCGQVYAPPGMRSLRNQQFGWSFQAWVVYQRLALRMSYRLISKATFDLFSEPLPLQTATGFVERCAEQYQSTEALLLRRILDGPVLHIDETKMNILGTDQYVWVLTDNARVVFQLRPNRETGFLKALLASFKGTLVSDFYGGYDALPCRQQKCLVHLLRDLNDDLWKNPFDGEFEKFVAAVRDLLCPILEDARRFGLKARHLGKHRIRVQRFYKEVIIGRDSEGETTARYRKRFERYQGSMFSFIEASGIPWHNNGAERALRHLAVQRKISGAFGEKGAVDYLRLLAVAQTCRFQQKSFLGFLLSRCMDVDEYIERSRVYPDWATDR